MNFIDYLASVITQHIPHEILDLALSRNINTQYRVAQPINTLIKDLILPRLLFDLNLSMGVELEIKVSDCTTVYQDDTNVVLHVPTDVLQNRRIISALSILNVSTLQPTINNTTISGLNETLHSRLAGQYNGNGLVELEVISGNEILVKNVSTVTSGVLRVQVSYSQDFREITPRYYMALSKLAILCAKLYIHTQLTVKVNQGSVYYGQEISVVQEIINSYAEVSEEYIDTVNINGSKLLFMQDEDTYTDYLKLSIGGTFI